MKVFITGIAGFLGSRVAEALLSAGHAVAGCDNLVGGYLDNVPEAAEFHQADCTYLNTMKKLIAGHEVVIHAACAAYEGLSVFSPHLITHNTFQISSTVFTACAATGVRRVLNCSSMARYGEQPRTPFTEEMVPNPVDPYGISKVAAEKLLQVLAQVHGFEYVHLVPHNIIGAHQKYDDPYRNVAAIMINLMLQGKQPVIYGDGRQQRCFTDARDILPCFLQALDSPAAAGQTINIGPDSEIVTIRVLAELIADLLPFPNLQPTFVDPRPQEVQCAVCSADKSRRIFEYTPRFDLRDSLADLTQWIRQRGPKRFRYHLDLEILNARTPKTWTQKLLR